MKRIILSIFTITLTALVGCNKINNSNMHTSQKWDKVFPLSENVNHRKVEFKNQYGITLVGDLYMPKNGNRRMAIAVCGPFGASKEQSSGLYAMKMAERGFITCAFAPLSQARAEANLALQPHPTSIRRTLWQRLIS